MKLEFSRQIFEKSSNIKFHENPPSGSRFVPCGQTQDGRTDMTKLIVVFCSFANAPNKTIQCNNPTIQCHNHNIQCHNHTIHCHNPTLLHFLFLQYNLNFFLPHSPDCCFHFYLFYLYLLFCYTYISSSFSCFPLFHFSLLFLSSLCCSLPVHILFLGGNV